MINESIVIQALDAIERQEARYLAWGLLDRSLSREDVESVVAEIGDVEPEDVVDELLRRLLIVEIPRSFPPRYRSRMAEGVRLFANLRQQFESRPWRDAPRLIADFRFLIRPRRFPERVHEPADVEQRLGGPALPDRSRRTLHALLADGSNSARKLSRFQIEATREILEGLRKNNDEARIVTAGTGSGKTLAFYLPTLMHLAADPLLGKETRVLSVYPRNELLKDQLVATLREVRKLRVGDPSVPAIRIGAYFGPTPLQAGHVPLPKYLGWRRRTSDGAWICSFLVCPGMPSGPECRGHLVWLEDEKKVGVERLHCEDCGATVEESEFVLTRKAMQKTPPDIVFTTTEMLNRSLADDWSAHVFGVGDRAKNAPRLVLLDEAHTYTGASGAQAAYVLRRWRHLAGGPVMWVGLSATLRDSEQFFAKLTGVSPDFTREIAPNSEDMIQRGHEYQLLLRGDPTSQTALLSASIQSLMLLLRLMDPLGSSDVSHGIVGNKVFAFCDNLDLINRLFRQLLDAEGRNPVGKINPERRGSLALLRSQENHPLGSAIVDWISRDADGQEWWVVDSLRDSPVPPKVGRTSSQDSGVDPDAEIVVSSSSLEVGFDDPTVGAVLQHKAPRDLAQFLQRRGRAGRSQSMRPWTIVVLSDYGRDRLAYQSYERLFDPELPPKTLPLGNRSVERMQATFALMDWVSIQLRKRTKSRGDVRKELTKPLNGDMGERQVLMAELLTEVLDDEGRLAELKQHLCYALRLSSEEVDAVLWEGPRSVLLEAIPTALRRLRSHWQIVQDGKIVEKGDRIREGHPLPEFLPSNLFSDLILPEVRIFAPIDYDEAANLDEPAFLALKQLAPGNVTLRYAVWKTKGLWVDPGEGGDLDISGSLLVDAAVIGEIDADLGRIEIFRPYSIAAEIPPQLVGSSSSGHLRWESRFTAIHGSVAGEFPDTTQWSRIVSAVDFYIHAGQGGIRLLRSSGGGVASITGRKGRRRFSYTFTNNGEPVAVGVEIEVDAVRFMVRPPSSATEFGLDQDDRRLRQLRRDFFIWALKQELEGAGLLNPFLSGWLAEFVIAGVAHAADSGAGGSPSTWSQSELVDQIKHAFGAAVVTDVDPEEESELQISITDALEQSGVVSSIAATWKMATGIPDDLWYDWLRARFIETTAAALQVGIQSLLPDFNVDEDIDIDIVDGKSENAEIFISDVAIGGGGLIEAFYLEYSKDPRRFWNLVRTALDPTDLESTSVDLARVIEGLVGNELADSAVVFRASALGPEALGEWRKFLRVVSQMGIPPSHSLSIALATRIFRPGSSAASDHAIGVVLHRLIALEETCGIALDVRTAAAVMAGDESIRDALHSAVPDQSQPTRSWAFGVILELLWPQAEAMRSVTLQAPIQYADQLASTERTLVLQALSESIESVDISQSNWRAMFDSVISANGRCGLEASSGDQNLLGIALMAVMGSPVEVGALLLHPRVVGFRRTHHGSVTELELPEAPQ